MTQTLDATIDQIESLYESVTGKKAPPSAPTPYAVIPPEKDPEIHIGEQIERLLGSLAQFANRPLAPATWAPPIWVGHGADLLLIHVDLPGVPREALQIRVSNGVLDVKGTRTPPGPDLPRGSCYAERPFGAFQRLIPIPEDAAADRIQAQLKDGVLTIKVPRLGPSSVEAKDIVVN